MANQDDADQAWADAHAKYPELAPEAVQQGRELIEPLRGRRFDETANGGVTIRFQTIWPYRLEGGTHNTYVSITLPPLDLRNGGPDLGKYIEESTERKLLGIVLPALEARAVELGIPSDSWKVAEIQKVLGSPAWPDSRLRDYLNRILHA